MTEKELEQEKHYKEMGNTYLDKCTKANGFVMLPMQIRDDLIAMYVAGAIENGIQWHDLRKDPNDLPDNYRYVWTNKGGAYYDIECKSWNDGDSWVSGVIAWCEPQFKE